MNDSPAKIKAIFLDRDGTIIHDPLDERVDHIEEIELFKDSIQALKNLQDLGYELVIITNQAGIAEGLITEEEFWQYNGVVIGKFFEKGIKINKTYMCPHSPGGLCECRKPKLAMLLNAAEELNIDMKNSWMIGDRESDILAGVNAGVKTILVKTGNEPVISKEADFTVGHIADAVEKIAKVSTSKI